MSNRRDRSERTRKRIIESARILFNRHGFDGVSIDDVMAHAGLTRGGFYRHFTAKADLYAVVLELSMASPLYMRGITADCTHADVARRLINSYLSHQHLENIDVGCSLVALPSDVARSDPTVKRVFQAAFNAIVSVFVRSFGGAAVDEVNRDRALAMTAICVGSMVVARALDDGELAEAVRSAGMKLALELGGLDRDPTRRRKRPRDSERRLPKRLLP